MGTKGGGLWDLLAAAFVGSGLGGALRVVRFEDFHCFEPPAISARVRPVTTEASISILASPSPSTVYSSRSLISSQLLRLEGLPRSERSRIRAHFPFSRSPCRTILIWPFLKAASMSGSCGSHVPRSHIC